MHKSLRILAIILFLGLFCGSLSISGHAEEITLTTYYPAPFGVYSQLRAKKIAVGNNYYDSTKHCWADGNCEKSDIRSGVDLAVEGDISSRAYCDKAGGNCVRFIKGKVDIVGSNNSSHSSVASVDFLTSCNNPMVFTQVNGTNDFVAHPKSVVEDGFKILLFGTSGKQLPGKKRKHSVDWLAVCAE